MWVHVGNPKILGYCSPTYSLEIVIVPDTVERRPCPTHYHTEFRRFRSSGMGVGHKKNWGDSGAPLPWDGRVLRPSPHVISVMLILVLVVKGSLRTKFKSLSLSLSLPAQSLTSPIP